MIVAVVRVGVLSGLLVCSGCHRKQHQQSSTHSTSNPVTEIQVSDPYYQSRLLRGFEPGSEGWRWTSRTFAVSLDAPEPIQRTTLTLDFSVPAELITQVNPVILTARVNGADVGRAEYGRAGRYSFRHEIPLKALERKPAEIEFSLAQAGKWPDGRELGVIVVGVSLAPADESGVSREMLVNQARAGYLKLLEDRKSQLPIEKQREMMKLFHDIPIWRYMKFHNVQIEKNPLDLWMMQQLIYEIQPDFVVETGTFRGGSALYWAHTLNGMGLEKSRVVTVDVQDLTKLASTHPLWKKYITFLLGSSTDQKIVSQISQMVQGRKVIVTLDSDHSMKHVLNELHAYAPMVPSGSYLVVEDTHIDGIPTQPDAGPGPLAAVQKFLSEPEGQKFEQDFSREALIMTFNPGGWLRRK